MVKCWLCAYYIPPRELPKELRGIAPKGWCKKLERPLQYLVGKCRYFKPAKAEWLERIHKNQKTLMDYVDNKEVHEDGTK